MERSRILVWDLPLRVFHWLLALSFAGAFLTAEIVRAPGAHLALGYTFLGLLAFRLVWGFVGSRHARFGSLAHGPAAVAGYLRSLFARRPKHYAGHNPAGSWAIVAILALGMAVAASGYAVQLDAFGGALEELHEAASYALLVLVAVHVAGVVVGSLAHRENLVAAMITGYKAGRPTDAIRGPRRAVAFALIGAIVAAWLVAADSAGGLAALAQAAPAGAHGEALAAHHETADDDD
jgi:cytochrome b